MVLENKAGSRRDKKKNLLTKVMGIEFEKAETGKILEAKKAYQLEEMLALINAKNKSALRVSEIDLTNTTIKMYFNAHFYAQGTYKNILKLTENGNLKKVVENLKMNGKSSGIITIGSKDYIAYSSKFE